MRLARWTAVLLLIVAASSGQAQGRRGFYSYSYGPRLSGAYGVGYAGYGYPAYGAVAPMGHYRSSLYSPTGASGIAGPRVVTWYTPGIGYTANVQTGLPWHAPRGLRASGTIDESTAVVARQQRALRRMETLHAVNHHQLGREYPAFLDQSLVADSKWKKKAKEAAEQPPATLPAADKSPADKE
jgi:hypothetical protein